MDKAVWLSWRRLRRKFSILEIQEWWGLGGSVPPGQVPAGAGVSGKNLEREVFPMDGLIPVTCWTSRDLARFEPLCEGFPSERFHWAGLVWIYICSLGQFDSADKVFVLPSRSAKNRDI